MAWNNFELSDYSDILISFPEIAEMASTTFGDTYCGESSGLGSTREAAKAPNSCITSSRVTGYLLGMSFRSRAGDGSAARRLSVG
jgi:hypothetical protein